MDRRSLPLLLSVLTLVLGVGLLIYMIAVEGEPGGIPLLLIAAGLGGLFVARTRSHPD